MQIRARFIFLFSCLSFFAKANLQTIVVDINGHGNFTSIQAALNSLPENAKAANDLVKWLVKQIPVKSNIK